MSKQYPYSFILASVIALLTVLLSMVCAPVLYEHEYAIAAIMILGLGVPHGATDYLIYQQLSGTSKRDSFVFIFKYVLMMAVYGVFWFCFPLLSLLIFIVMSIYHFGQSNWENLLGEVTRLERILVALLWGSYVLIAPLLLHQSTTLMILEPLLGESLATLSNIGVLVICSVLFVGNLVWMISAYVRNLIDARVVFGELLNLLILLALFWNTPLLVGFAVYFTCWHSLGSVNDQIQFFRQKRTIYSWKNYLRDVIPFSVLALLGMVFWVYFQTNTIVLSEVNMIWIFSFIALLTLPHMMLIDGVYERLRVG